MCRNYHPFFATHTKIYKNKKGEMRKAQNLVLRRCDIPIAGICEM